MTVFKKIGQALIVLCFSLHVYSQRTIKEDDYTLNYLNKKIELVFNNPVKLIAHDAFTNEEIAFLVEKDKPNTFVFEQLKPAEIVKINFNYLYNRNAELQTTYIANQSTSTGTINVYFNHPVNTAFAQTENAVNLSNTLDDMLISYIDACVATLDIAIYSSYSSSGTTGIAGAINAAYTRGVQVRVIYNGSTSNIIPLLNPAIPTLISPSGTSYGIMHNKFVVFDANNTNANLPYVWTGSTNWTTSQIDGPDKNNVIVIQDQALALGYKLEFEEMWGSSSMTPNLTLSKFGPFKTDNTPHNYVIGGKTVNNYFSPSDGVNAKIINAINSANSDIDIATMLITRSDISTALINKYNSGNFNTFIVLDSQNPSGNQFANLQSGISSSQVLSYTGSGIMHHKFMVIDNFDSSSDPQVLVGSHNWSSSAENKNDENTLIIHDANITNQYYQAFAYLYQEAGGFLSSNENNPTTNELVLYPNPTSGEFTITKKNSFEDSNIAIYDILGKRVLKKQYNNLNNEIIDISNQANGLYFVDVNFNDKTQHFKLVKK
jgi:phosphatidylserine/phosphatidylglycerophosphate/cardiolipin synthase-like enzyme